MGRKYECDDLQRQASQLETIPWVRQFRPSIRVWPVSMVNDSTEGFQRYYSTHVLLGCRHAKAHSLTC